MSNQPKYKTSFSSRIKVLTSEEKDQFLAKASLDELRHFLPEYDVKSNFDLMGFAMSSYNVGVFNKNFDGVMAEDALQSYKNFLYKPLRASIVHNVAKSLNCVPLREYKKPLLPHCSQVT